jgi:CheY-like chemotaxis protein
MYSLIVASPRHFIQSGAMPSAEGNERFSEPNPGRKCVLVVDDDVDSLRASVRLLDLNGYDAHGARGFHDALDVWTSKPCEILVADIMLPDGSGLDLMRRLRPSGVRGVAVSGHVGPEHHRASLEAGFSAHLAKPFRFTDLLAAIARLS